MAKFADIIGQEQLKEHIHQIKYLMLISSTESAMPAKNLLPAFLL